MSKLVDHVSHTTKSKQIIDFLEVIGRAVAYLTDAAVGTVHTTVKSTALLNSARRALWVKTWDGDHTSKTQLYGLPFEGFLLFGTGLDQALSRSTEKGKKFPVKLKKDKGTFFSRLATTSGIRRKARNGGSVRASKRVPPFFWPEAYRQES